MMRILITGAHGQLGHELQQVLVKHSLLLLDRPGFDLLNPTKAEHQILDARPEVVIHSAAFTDVDRAEQESNLAMAVNTKGTECVARAAAACGARLIYLSTDYVFDGKKRSPYTETNVTNPLNTYGHSKLAGEQAALAQCPRTLVVRTSWLYGPKGKNFVATIMRLAAVKPNLQVVADQRGCPTYARDLAQVLDRILDQELLGILHASGSGDCSWYEFACEIISLRALMTPVIPITTKEFNRPASRPLYSVLSNEKLAELGLQLPHWKDALTKFLNEVQVPAGTSVSQNTKDNLNQ